MTDSPSGRSRSSPQTLSVPERRLVAGWAADCAGYVLHHHDSQAPGDPRVRAAIDQTRAFASGVLDVREAIRTRGGEAGAAARAADDPAAKAAAYAAEQAAAVAHMGAHALGACGYAGKAQALASAADDDHVIHEVTELLLGLASDEVRAALADLPTLGENTAGPLGPGRLSGGLVGRTIVALQAKLGRP